MTMISIGANIKSRRRALGLTQAELAKQLGLTQANVSRIEANVKGPSADLLLSIAEVLECDVHELLGVAEKPQDDAWVLGQEAKTFVLRTMENDPQFEVHLRRFVRNHDKLTDEDWKFVASSLKLALGFAEESIKAKRLGKNF